MLFPTLLRSAWVLLAGFVPPPSPATSAERIARLYRHRLLGIRVGMVLALFASSLLLPWGDASCAQRLRIEAQRSPLVWAWIAVLGYSGPRFLSLLEYRFTTPLQAPRGRRACRIGISSNDA